MRQKTFPFLLLGMFLLFLVALPKTSTDRLRSSFVSAFSPVWKMGASLKAYLSDRPIGKMGGASPLEKLERENGRLKRELEPIIAWLSSEKKIQEEALEWKKIVKEGGEFRKKHFQALLEKQKLSLGAQVIYRDPSSWSSSIWINVGEEDNCKAGQKIVEKNSPVLSGASLIGVVDYVGRGQSRVRLITDSAVSPAVRAVRGSMQNGHLLSEMRRLWDLLDTRDDVFSSKEEKGYFKEALKQLSGRLTKDVEDLFLAKGELHGASSPLWRAQRPLLKGIGFNFDFPDTEGTLGFGEKRGQEPILREGDLLVTSGLDGVFPAGLWVGTILAVKPPDLGGYTYEIEALPTATDLNDLHHVFVFPPLNNE